MRSSGFTKHHIKRDVLALEERDPSLIDLPLALPSIPVLSPILTPLIGGDNDAAQQTTTTAEQQTPTTAPPAPSPTPTQPSNGGGGSSGGGNSGGGSSGGSGGSGGNSGGGNGGNGGNGGGAKSSAAPPPPPVTQPTNGGGGGGSSPKPTTAATPQPSASKCTANPSVSSPASPSPSSGSGGASGSGAGGGSNNPNDTNYGAGSEDTPENSGNGSAPSNSVAPAGSEQPSTTVPGSPVPVASGVNGSGSGNTIYPGSSSTITGDPSSSSTPFTGSAAVEHKGISTGGIAAIVIVCFFFLLFLILFFLRRRSIARRSERRNRWWFSARDSSNFSLPGAVGSDGGRSEPGTAGPGITSARSSFATNFDQGLMLRVDSPAPVVPFNSALVAPNLPPMAEVRERNSRLIASASADARRSSMNSMMSNGSDDNPQYLLVPGDANRIGQEVSTPMSVRPFSPSESFAFPKPPSQSGDAGPLSSDSASFSPRILSPKTSESTLVPQLSSPPFGRNVAVPVPTLTHQAPSPTEFVPASNPFADPQPQPDPTVVDAEFAAVETIRRPFAPTLEDELNVVPGDSVRILKVFDDGWTFVERAGTKGAGEKGLIPVDCLREAGQALPAFLAQKRVSSYGGDKPHIEEMLDNMLEHGTAM